MFGWVFLIQIKAIIMRLQVKKSRIQGEISVPGSKSHTIRAVAAAAMADGASHIRSALFSADTDAAVAAARAFGAVVDLSDPQDWLIAGINGEIQRPAGVVDLLNSGTSLRIFTALAALADFPVSFDGDASLRTRVMKNVLDALQPLGVTSHSLDGKCPLTVCGPLRGGHTRVDGKSSQFVTALLFAAPFAPEDTVMEVVNLNEVPYVEITIDWLHRLGVDFDYAADYSWFKVRGRQHFSAFDLAIPADFSTATFPLAAAAVTGGEVLIHNLDFKDRQGDKAVFDYFTDMGVEVIKGAATQVRMAHPLQAIEVDLNRTPDALPAMAAVAACAKGKTWLKNVPQARIKETDRIACMTRELRKMGAAIEELPDGMVITGGKLHGAEVDGCHDHRIVMALTIAGLAAEGITTVSTAEAADVTYPAFVTDFQRLGADINVLHDEEFR